MSQHSGQAIIPTRLTIFLRTFIPWQLLRFVAVNIKMTFMILKSHNSELSKKTEEKL